MTSRLFSVKNSFYFQSPKMRTLVSSLFEPEANDAKTFSLIFAKYSCNSSISDFEEYPFL